MKQTNNKVTFLLSYKSRFNLNCWQRFCQTAKLLNGSSLQRFRDEESESSVWEAQHRGSGWSEDSERDVET